MNANSPTPEPVPPAASPSDPVCVRDDEVAALLVEFAHIPDPRAARGRRFPLPPLLALSVCALTPAGNDPPDGGGRVVPSSNR